MGKIVLSRLQFLSAVGLAVTGLGLEACSADDAATGDAGSTGDAEPDTSATDAGGVTDGNTADVTETGLATDSGHDAGHDAGVDAAATCASGAKDNGIDDPTHHLVVPAADVVAATPKTYAIQGTSSHSHNVTLSAADFAKLAVGMMTTVTSTTTFSHNHIVTVICA